MQLTISTTVRPATDLGFLLHKNPASVRSIDLAFGTASVLYPEATEERCAAALVVDVDPVRLVRRGRGAPAFALAEFVNDRPYVASSFLSTAISKAFGTALSGRSQDRQQLADAAIPLEARLPVVSVRGAEDVVGRLFEPLGYETTVAPIPLDATRPDWGDSRYVDLTLRGTVRLRDLLRHLYVLLPVLDDDKHYWVERSEIDKLVAKGEEWLGAHPERELITRRYLRYRAPLMREALARLTEDGPEVPDEAAQERDEAVLERQVSLAEQRLGTVLSVLRAGGPTSVADLGCGAGKLLQALLKEGSIERIVGVDVSAGALEAAARRLRLEQMSPRQRERITLFQSSLTYRDRRLRGLDAAVLMEVVEHVDADRLPVLARSVFGEASPRLVVITTPNVEYNVRFHGLPDGSPRHSDHRFEWSRDEFRAWGDAVGDTYGYRVRYLPVGPTDANVGPPTQMAVFER